MRQVEQAAADAARLHAPEDVRTSTADWLVAVYVRAGRWDDATAAAVRVLADRERTLGADHPRTVDVRNRAALYAQVRRSDLAQARSGGRGLARGHRAGAGPLRRGACRPRHHARTATRRTGLPPRHRGRGVKTVTLTADTPLHQRLAADFILLGWRLADRPAHHRRVDPTDMHDPAAYRAAAATDPTGGSRSKDRSGPTGCPPSGTPGPAARENPTTT